ncbi:hypothetical protein, partial [uncultured Ruminococcus sp.]|uniref:hypothetical protein n=1 Tax=uncultured Ruminococcus sp. TaxID=165186 RepID=UPI0025E75FE4
KEWRRSMKRTLSLLIGTAAAVILGAINAAAENVSPDTRKAVETSDGVTFSVASDVLSASQFKEDTKITVSLSETEGDECPVKLVLNYWDANTDLNNGIGAPASVEAEATEYKDGNAVFDYDTITAALGDTDLSMVYSIDVLATGETVTCKGFEATDVYSAAEMAENDILRTTWVHVRKPKETDNWGQSASIGVDQFDTSTMTDKTWVIAQFESELPDDTFTNAVELILQSTDDTVSPKAKNGTVWGKVSPVLFNNHYAMFLYEDMVDAYGTEDMSCVTVVYVGDTGNGKIKCTDLYALRCKTLFTEEPEEESSEAVTEESSQEESTAESTVETDTSADAAAVEENSNDSHADEKTTTKKNIVFIIIGIVAGIVIAGIVVYIILGKKSKEAYDISKHRFIKK